jgi:ketopantoate hydroxymethyltransferase
VKQYANLGAATSKAARSYIDDVVNRKFPDEEHAYR